MASEGPAVIAVRRCSHRIFRNCRKEEERNIARKRSKKEERKMVRKEGKKEGSKDGKG
jgi:hypothetical protein